jgi:hypothetical protein
MNLARPFAVRQPERPGRPRSLNFEHASPNRIADKPSAAGINKVLALLVNGVGVQGSIHVCTAFRAQLRRAVRETLGGSPIAEKPSPVRDAGPQTRISITPGESA